MKYEKIENPQIGQSVFVTVTGTSFYKGEIIGYGTYDFYPNKRSYQILVQRNKDYSFIEYFDTVYKEAS